MLQTRAGWQEPVWQGETSQGSLKGGNTLVQLPGILASVVCQFQSLRCSTKLALGAIPRGQ